jgi:hypothetical protein
MQHPNSKQSCSTKLLLKLYKIFNKSGSLFAVAPMIVYMGPPDINGGGDLISTTTPVLPPNMMTPPDSTPIMWALGVLIFAIFIIGCVTVIRWIARGAKHIVRKSNTPPKQ